MAEEKPFHIDILQIQLKEEIEQGPVLNIYAERYFTYPVKKSRGSSVILTGLKSFQNTS